MASGAIVGYIERELPPATSYAPYDVRVGGSSPAEAVLVASFAAGGTTYMDYLVRLVGYQGGGITVTLGYAMASATTGTVRWGVAMRRLDASEDVDGSHSYAFTTTDVSVPSTAGVVGVAAIDLNDGSEMDGTVDGDLFILRIERTTVTGDASGAAQLLSVTITEQ